MFFWAFVNNYSWKKESKGYNRAVRSWDNLQHLLCSRNFKNLLVMIFFPVKHNGQISYRSRNVYFFQFWNMGGIIYRKVSAYIIPFKKKFAIIKNSFKISRFKLLLIHFQIRSRAMLLGHLLNNLHRSRTIILKKSYDLLKFLKVKHEYLTMYEHISPIGSYEKNKFYIRKIFAIVWIISC